MAVQESEAAEDFAAAHGKVAAPLAVAVPVALAAGLVHHVPLPDGFDLAGDGRRIHLPQLRPDGSLDVDFVRVPHVSGHFVAVGVVVPMPAPPEEALLIDQVLQVVAETGVGEFCITRLSGRLAQPVHGLQRRLVGVQVPARRSAPFAAHHAIGFVQRQRILRAFRVRTSKMFISTGDWTWP